jgi:hypothetical protein
MTFGMAGLLALCIGKSTLPGDSPPANPRSRRAYSASSRPHLGEELNEQRKLPQKVPLFEKEGTGEIFNES